MAARKIPTVPQRALADALERHREAAGLVPRGRQQDLEWSEHEGLADRDRPGHRVAGRHPGARQAVRHLTTRAPRRWSSWPGRPSGPAGGRAWRSPCPQGSPSTWSWNRPPAPSAPTRPSSSRACGRPRPTPGRCSRARSVTSTPEQIERQVPMRMRRQQILDRPDPKPPEIWAILDEAVIRRVVGGRDVMRGQLARLREVSGSARSPSRSCRSAPAPTWPPTARSACSTRATLRFPSPRAPTAPAVP